jgi:mono/diheme cytochrome c family protein
MASQPSLSRCSRPSVAGISALERLLALVLLSAPAAYAAPAAAQVVFQQSCAPCHGTRGEGGLAPQLAGRSLAATVVSSRVRQGGLVMPAFSAQQMSDRELQDLVTYISGLPVPTAAELLPSPSARAPGATVFQARCLACHGAEARGGFAPGILNTSLSLPRFTNQVRHGGGLMPPFPAAQVGDAQVRELYAYVHPPLARPDPGVVDPLPAMPGYLGDFLFALAALALLAQVGSERRRRLRLRIRAEEELVSAQMPQDDNERVRIRVF